MPLRTDPRQQARLQSAPVIPTLPPEPSLESFYTEQKTGGLTRVFQTYDRARKEWSARMGQHLGRIQDALVKLTGKEDTQSLVAAYAIYTINDDGTVVEPATRSSGPEIEVLPAYPDNPEWFIYRVNMPEGYEDSILRMSFKLGPGIEVDDALGESEFLGPRKRTQLAGGDIGAAPFQWGYGRERDVWAGDARLILDDLLGYTVGDVYHIPLPISRLLLEII